MRILGIDPGLNLTGYGCVELAAGRGSLDPELIEAGVFRLDTDESIAHRLVQLHEDLNEVLDDLRPELVAVEQLFSHYRHVRTSILMGHARGVVLLAAQARGLRIQELMPTMVKKALTGNGHASKEQMQQAVMVHCRLSARPEPPDVADAIAVALCAARRLVLEAPAVAR